MPCIFDRFAAKSLKTTQREKAGKVDVLER